MPYFFLYMLIGALAGILSGILGIGGGIIVIPLLVWVYKVQFIPSNFIMHMAAGTSLAIMIFNTSSSLYGHIKHDIQIWPIYRKLVIGIIVGTIAGAILSHFLYSNILEIIFGVFIFIIAIQMLIGKKPKPGRKLPGIVGASSVAFLIGGKSGLLGLGGGIITIPFLQYCNIPIRNTIAISCACSLTIAIIGSISFMLTGIHAPNLPRWSLGYVYLPAFLGIILTGPLCAQLGAFFSHKIPKETLKRILGAVLLLVAIKMLV